ncbi:MAG: Crp/Fnr family transcriptional regulator [Burkholderiaceae bacterium]|nr:Crp/Fnr family transcriptional regulator [Burkholderiaceae bacterium]
MAPSENHLIALLPRKDRLRLLASCESVELQLSDELATLGSVTRDAFFPVSGFISLVTHVDTHPGLEVGMVGSEGMLGAQLALGMTLSPLRALVQGPGSAWRIGAPALRLELANSAALQGTLNAYLAVQMAQLASSSGCLRFHRIGPRLARWLLMSHDRAHCDTFRVTHEFLALMLGVRRVGITMAAGTLQRDHLIAYHRGELTVLDRTGLEAAACSCYGTNRRAYSALLPRVRLAH